MARSPMSGPGRRAAQAALALVFALTCSWAAACTPGADLQARDLLGLWRVQFEGGPAPATLLLEPHREWAGSLSGTINRNGERARLAGDIDEGVFTLEESADGVRISAVWVGEPVEGSCGREIRGTWRAGEQGRPHAFVLRRVGSW